MVPVTVTVSVKTCRSGMEAMATSGSARIGVAVAGSVGVTVGRREMTWVGSEVAVAEAVGDAIPTVAVTGTVACGVMGVPPWAISAAR